MHSRVTSGSANQPALIHRPTPVPFRTRLEAADAGSRGAAAARSCCALQSFRQTGLWQEVTVQ